MLFSTCVNLFFFSSSAGITRKKEKEKEKSTKTNIVYSVFVASKSNPKEIKR